MTKLNILPQVTQARNGVGAFVYPCKRVTLTYCNFGGSSAGMREFLRLRLKGFAAQYPEVEFRVLEKTGKHPVLKGEYSREDLTKQICARKWNIDVIENKLKLILNSSGKNLSKVKNSVESNNESVRGVWSPFYVHPNHRFKI
ncbi:mitochondrial 54S ribosomal protein [Martiniozyma asiatica (nom. inval.)]|nr:mitochondrial 54S ribosomal protein [Martiniozyma asiatica]